MRKTNAVIELLGANLTKIISRIQRKAGQLLMFARLQSVPLPSQGHCFFCASASSSS